jgi:hypothetical protein
MIERQILKLEGLEVEPMNIPEISKAFYTNENAVRAAAELAQTFLNLATPGAAFSSTALLRGIGVPLAHMKGFNSKLSVARSGGLLPEGVFYKKGKPNGGTFGKPSILWLATDASVTDASKGDDEEWMRQRLAQSKRTQ